MSVTRANSSGQAEKKRSSISDVQYMHQTAITGNTHAKPPAGSTPKRGSLAESLDSLKVPSIVQPISALRNQRRSQDITRMLPRELGQKRKRYILRGNVYVTFPFVYHSVGEQTCPRYSLFRECTDYDPYTRQVPGTRGSQGKMSTSLTPRGSNASLKSILSMSTSRRNSQVPAGEDGLPSNSRRGSKRVSFSNVAHVVRAVQDTHR